MASFDFSTLMTSLSAGELPADLPYKEAVLCFTLFMHTFEVYLECRQLVCLRKTSLPAALQGVIKEDTFQKSRAYSLDKWNFSMVKSTYSLIEGVVIIWYELLPLLWNWTLVPLAAMGLTAEYEIVRSIIFTLVYILLTTVIGLPWSIYGTFVLEARHGFNKQTPSLFVKDIVKTFLLALVFVPILEGMLIPIIQFGGKYLALWLWLFMFSVAIVMMTIYPTVIAPLFNKYDPLPEGSLRSKIEALAGSLEFPLKKLYVVDGSTRSSHSNAYMYGFFKNKRIVLFDTLIKQCEDNEELVVAVLAHELGHWKEGHTVRQFVSGQVVSFVQFGLYTVVRNTDAIFTSFGYSDKPALIGLLLFQFIISPIDHIVGFVFNILSRMYEFQADAFAKKLGYAKELREGLIRLQEENKGAMNIDPMYSAYHHSHPPLVERLEAIDMKKDD